METASPRHSQCSPSTVCRPAKKPEGSGSTADVSQQAPWGGPPGWSWCSLQLETHKVRAFLWALVRNYWEERESTFNWLRDIFYYVQNPEIWGTFVSSLEEGKLIRCFWRAAELTSKIFVNLHTQWPCSPTFWDSSSGKIRWLLGFIYENVRSL